VLDVAFDQEVMDVDTGPHGLKYRKGTAIGSAGCGASVRFEGPWRLPGAALAADPLVELDAVSPLGGVAALLSTDPADPAEELVTVALLGGETTLTSGLSSGHLLLLHGPTSLEGCLVEVRLGGYPRPRQSKQACLFVTVAAGLNEHPRSADALVG
jgi:hypothetical protein